MGQNHHNIHHLYPQIPFYRCVRCSVFHACVPACVLLANDIRICICIYVCRRVPCVCIWNAHMDDDQRNVPIPQQCESQKTTSPPPFRPPKKLQNRYKALWQNHEQELRRLGTPLANWLGPLKLK